MDDSISRPTTFWWSPFGRLVRISASEMGTQPRWDHIATLCTYAIDGCPTSNWVNGNQAPFMQIEHKLHNINLVWIFLSFECVSALTTFTSCDRPAMLPVRRRRYAAHADQQTFTRWTERRNNCRTQKWFSGVVWTIRWTCSLFIKKRTFLQLV